MSESDAFVGTRLGPYRIDRLLGEGAMGEVFLAIHEVLGRHVAIKTLKPQVAADRAMTERFFSEARAVNIIRHENIVECTDLVNDPTGKSYIVMELLEGRTLSGAIREARRIAPVRAVKIGAQIADALAAAHGKGIVHRDLKPDNVFLIKRAGSSDYVKVLDFGMARLRPDLAGGQHATQSGALIGTPSYMSPEQARGEKVGPSADVYALGVVLYHMLTGELPFAAASLTLMLIAVVQETPPRVDKLAPDTPAALVALIASALDKDPTKRPADMATFRKDMLESVGLPVETLASVAAGTSPLSSVASPSVALSETLDSANAAWSGQTSTSSAASEVVKAAAQSSPPRTRRSMWPWLAGAGAVFGLASGAYFTFRGSSQPELATAPPAAVAPAPAPPPAPTPAAPTASAPPPAPVESALDVAQRELASAQKDLAAAQAIYSDKHPTVIGAKNRVAAAEQKLREAKGEPEPLAVHHATPPPRQHPHPVVTASGSGSAASTPPPPPAPPPPDKVDRTKQLVGPKAQ